MFYLTGFHYFCIKQVALGAKPNHPVLLPAGIHPVQPGPCREHLGKHLKIRTEICLT